MPTSAYPPSAHAHFLPAEGGGSAHVCVRVNRSTLSLANPAPPAVNGAAGGKVEFLVRRAFGAMCSDFRRAESGTELLARLEGRRSLKEIEPCLFVDEDEPVHGDILEFHGPEGTGKTEMLYHLTARCILPQSAGGLEIEVLFIDTDYHFDLLRLVTILEHRLSQSSEEMIKFCLGRLFLVYCCSSSQLLLTLYSLEAMFCSHPSLCLLILDSLSAFYWIDRANGGESVNLQESTLKKCSQLLEKLVNEYRLVLFATTQSIMQKTSTSTEASSSGFKRPTDASVDYRPYLCKAWQQLVKQRLFFSKDDSKASHHFSLVSRNLKSNTLKKYIFIIRESGVEFC